MRFSTTKTDGSLTTVAVLLALTLFLPDSILTEEHNRVVCYYTNWSVYRPGTAKFSPQNINPYLCTHLIYAFGGFTKENSFKPFDKYQDIEKGGYAKFTGLKTYNKNLKTMLAIGGWNEGSSRFSPMVASPERRKEMIRNAIKFLRQNHFDGLDLDWEYPAFRDGGKPRDRNNYAQLVQELREEFNRESRKTGRPRLLLTMAVPAGLEYIDKGYDIPKLNKYLDWMNILSYDYHSAFEPSVNHHSPLYSLTDTEDDEYNFDGDLNIDATIKHYIESGADRDKLVVGIPTYGRSYTLFNPDANEIGAPADGPGEMGDATRENGYLAYYEICENLKNGGWKVVQPNPKAMGPYAYKGNQWVGFDDEQIVRRKSEYVAQMGLGGIMFWAIDNDDFRGACGGKPYPLIETAKEALLNAPTDNLVVLPKRKRPNKDSDNEISTRGSPVRNSGGPQGNVEEDTSVKDNRGRKRVRIQNNKNSKSEQQQTKPRNRASSRRRTRPTTESTSTTVPSTTPQWNTRSTTPEPPATPDPGSDFKCEDEGFFPHPRDCKKYFWCLSSGPSELGIIAHQFTCPSGLYFNKAADSCDYTQNVLCNKKLKKASTTSAPTTTSTTTQSTTTTTKYVPVFSTRRAPPKITAATSRTTFLYTTSTTTEEPEFEDEYEYVDEDEEESTPDSEEDPRVIKELIELIRKAGGIEQLEKYLQVSDNGTTSAIPGVTTPATISKSLYERVLSKTGSTNPLFQNSNSRPQYQTISRQRPQTTERESTVSENPVEETGSKTTQQRRPGSSFSRFRPQGASRDEEDDDVGSTKRPGAPEYVTIRRNRPTTSTTESDGLEYVTIRRPNKPQEDTTTSKYTTIVRRRPTTESNDNNESETDEPKQQDDIENQTTQQTIEDTNDKKDSLGVVVQLPSQEGVIKTGVIDSTASPDFSSTVSSTTERPSTPVLFKPRPFVVRPRPTKLVPSSTTEQPTTTTRKVSQRVNGPTRGTSRFTSRRRPTTEAPQEYDEYDSENSDIGRTFRPAHLADLSSLTSADIQFGNGNGRRPSRRRPTSQSPTTSTTETILSSDLKTGSRTIPLARKNLLASLDTSKNTRRLVRPITNTPDQSIPLKVSTTYKIDTPKPYSTISRTKPSVINDELTTFADLEDSTGSDTDNSFKITEPETTTEQVFARTRKVIKRIRPASITSSPVPDDGTSVETNKAVVRRRPINREESELKLSESTINDGTRIGNNGLQTHKVIKRKKIIRKLRPVKKEEDTTEFGNKVRETTIENERTTRKKLRVLEETSSSTERRPISRRLFSRTTTEKIKIEPILQIISRFGDLESVENEPERPRQRTRVVIRQRGSTTTEAIEDVTSESNFIGEPDITTSSEEDVSTLSKENITEDDVTTEALTTTTSTTPQPRSTVASLIGRARPAYRPRGRTPTTPEPQSSTTSSVQYRRRQRPQFNARTSTALGTSSTTLSTTTTTEVPITETEGDLIEITATEELTTTPEESISTVIDEMLKELTTMLDEEQITTTEDRPTFITEAMVDTTPLETTQTEREQESTIPEATTEALTTSTSTTEKEVPITTTQQSTTASSTQEPRTTRLRISTTTQAPTSEATERSTTPKVLRRYKPGDRAKARGSTPKPSETTEENKPKFVPVRPAEQRPRFILRRENKTQENEELKPARKFIPQGRKLTLPKSTPESSDLDKEAEIEADEPNNEVQENLTEKKNTPFPGRGVIARNYTRKFSNKPIYTTTPSTTTAAIQPEILARNKQLFSNPRKINIPIKPTTEESPSTEETSTEPQQLSTLIHVFAEIKPTGEGQETTQVPDMTTEMIGSKNLEKLVEVNRIVEVSVEENLNNKTVPKTKVLNPQIAKVGQISRLTVINVVGGDNNNFATLDDILSGKKIFSSFPSKVSFANVTEEISTVPNDQETNLNILNNTLEIIEANKKFEIFSKSNVVDYSPKKVDPISSAIQREGPPAIIESVLSSSSEKTDTVATTTQTETPNTEDVTQTSSEKSNTLDDQDLLQSANKRVKIKILEPVYSPIVAESFQEIFTTKAEVVEVPQKNQEIRIAPIEVALS